MIRFDKKKQLWKKSKVSKKLYKKRNLCDNYAEFLTNVPKISEAARAAMEADLTLEELRSTIKSKAMEDTAPSPEVIPYSGYFVKDYEVPYNNLKWFLA